MAIVEIHLATLDIDTAEMARCAGLISPAERDRAARFRFDRDRRRFIARRGRLRALLAERVGGAPETLSFAAGPFGKPMLPGGPHFSASHSGERMMIALAEVEIGCDIERVDETIDWQPIAGSFFSPGECRALAALPAASRRRSFFDCWSRKEAFVKALGQGLSYPLKAFDVSVGPEAALLAGGAGWSIAAASRPAGYAGAVVARDDGGPVDILW